MKEFNVPEHSMLSFFLHNKRFNLMLYPFTLYAGASVCMSGYDDHHTLDAQ